MSGIVRKSLALRLLIIAGLSLLLLIPTLMVMAIIDERQETREEAISEVSGKWGGTQYISGPVLTLPYKEYYKGDKGKVLEAVRYAHFLPEDIKIKGDVIPVIRNRGIYDIVLYTANLSISGVFGRPKFENLGIAESAVIWKDASLTIGVSDMSGIKDAVTIKFNKENLSANPGLPVKDLYASGINVKPNINGNTSVYEFSTEINIDGSNSLFFAPIGKETKVELNSTWTNPGFTGEFLPEDPIELNKSGFKADWKILNLNRNFPQEWIEDQHSLSNSYFGVNLIMPVDQYQKTMRTAKYAIMFITLTFLTFFMIELLGRKILHPLHYLLIGFALVLFYTLLLSFSEHMGFNFAYLLGSISIIILITLYAASILSGKKHALSISGVLIILYGYLYVILQLQDYALIMGSIGLFLILAVVMFLTRKIDWFSAFSSKNV